MTDTVRLWRAVRAEAEGTPFLEVEIVNGSASRIGAGGLLMRAKSVYGEEIVHFSVSNHWPVEAGGRVHLSLVLPRDRLKHIDFVRYVETNGMEHALSSRLVIGWFSSKLTHGTVGADV